MTAFASGQPRGCGDDCEDPTCADSSNAFSSYPTRSDLDLDTNPQGDDSTVQLDEQVASNEPIVIEKCGDLEDGRCNVCHTHFGFHDDGKTSRRGQDKCVKVSDPRYHVYGISSWRHANCWDARHPSITILFDGSQDGSIILSLFENSVNARPSLLEGWQELNCADRWMVLQRIFYQNLSSYSPSLGHVVCFVPCKSCPTCQSPIRCSWSIFGCNQPAMQTLECPVDGCTNQIHHICQIEWQQNTNSEETATFCCVDHHAGARAHRRQWSNQVQNQNQSVPTRTTAPPPRGRARQLVPPLNRNGTPGNTGRATRSPLPRGRSRQRHTSNHDTFDRNSDSPPPVVNRNNSSNSPPPPSRRPRTRSQTNGQSNIANRVRQRTGHVRTSNPDRFG